MNRRRGPRRQSEMIHLLMPNAPLRQTFPNNSNGLVSFYGHDVIARDLLNDLCRQVGWSYSWTIKHYIQFSRASQT